MSVVNGWMLFLTPTQLRARTHYSVDCFIYSESHEIYISFHLQCRYNNHVYSILSASSHAGFHVLNDTTAGGKTLLPHILSNLPPMLSSEDWRCRHAAMMAISACGEGCHKQMENLLSDVLKNVVPFTKDSHPRVRYAACNALGQMSTDFQPNLQKKYHQLVS